MRTFDHIGLMPKRVAETLPAINLDAILKAVRGKLAEVEWFRRDVLFGEGSFLALAGRLEFTFSIDGYSPYTMELPIIETSNGVTTRRRRFSCPGCGQPCSVLFYHGGWQCRTCHGLIYASQKRAPNHEQIRLWDAAKVMAHRQRKAGEHRATFERKQAEAWEKLKRWGPRPDESLVTVDSQDVITTTYSGGPPD